MTITSTAVPIPLLSIESGVIVCPTCGRTGPTITRPKTGVLTWLACFSTCLAGCSCGCCLIPFCMDAMRDVQHICSHCNQVLATYERL